MKSPNFLLLIGLLFAAIPAGLEIQAFFAAPRNWDKLLSPPGLVAIVAWAVLFVCGLAAFVLALVSPARPAAFSVRLLSRAWSRAAAAAVLMLAPVWLYLYSPWQEALRAPWMQFIFALGMAQLVAWFSVSDGDPWPDGRGMVMAFGLFLYPRVVLELRTLSGQALIYRSATVLGYLLMCGLALWLFTSAGRTARERLAGARNRLGGAAWWLAAFFLCAPLIYYLIFGPVNYVVNPSLRFSLLLIEVYGLAALIGREGKRLTSFKTVLISALGLAVVSAFINNLLLVINYPFSLSWSEGNRFYDYSLVFGQNLYDYSGAIPNPYSSIGRYVLWGILFLIPGLPIGVHRFWNVLLITLPPILVGWFLGRRVLNPYLRAAVLLSAALLFIVDSPLHPPFLLAAVIVLAFMFSPSPLVRGLSLAFAAAYAGLSRWTWIPVTAAWGVLIDLVLYYPARSGGMIKRLAPAFMLGLVGIASGIVAGYQNIFAPISAQTFSQPLLWYRLLPNPTFPLGVLLSVIIVSGPLLAILLWWVASRRWKLDVIQQLAVWGAVIGFLAAGLIVSTKIGGGADLHNMDMYLMTLTLVVGLGLYGVERADGPALTYGPVWLQLLLGLAILFPLYGFTPFSSGAASSLRLELAGPKDVDQTLDEIRGQVLQADRSGEVLFMDQRQLLTFGYVRGVPFVPEYEKKYMMDQALAGNSVYFQGYYHDLSQKRFGLIVTEVLRTKQETLGDFSEENNLWVKWVSAPTLCFYEPLAVYKDVNVELLVPKQEASGCGMYLSGE